MLINNLSWYAMHKNEVIKTSALFLIRLKPNAKLQNERPPKVQTRQREKLIASLAGLEKNEVFRQIS